MGMRLYKHNFNNDGKRRESLRWYCDVRVDGKRYRLPLFESKVLSQRFADRIADLIALRAGGDTPGVKLQEWINGLSPSMQNKLAKWGLISGSRAAGRSSVDSHLDDWRDALLAGGTGEEHAVRAHQRAGRIFRECGFQTLADIQGDKVAAAIGRLQKTVRGKNNGRVNAGPASARSKLHFVRACKQFSRWCFINGRLPNDPLTHLSIKNVQCKNPRRALSADEVACLLGYTETAPMIFGLPGYERSIIYELAVTTGLRRNEIKSITRSSFDFKRLSVRVEAKDTKNKKAAVLPVKAALMDKIKQHVSGKLPTAKAFDVPQAAAIMLKQDLADARRRWIRSAKDNPAEHRRRAESDFLKVETHEGKVDFHSLRHTFGTLLAAAGVHPKTAMDLMRHSDINLTMALYTHGNHEQQTQAVESLPTFEPLAEAKEKQA